MDDFFPFIHIPKKEIDFEQINLYIEDIEINLIKEDEKEEERVIIIDIL